MKLLTLPPRPPDEPDPTLLECAESLMKHVKSGEITGCVVLAFGPDDGALCYAEGGTFSIPDILYAFELWKIAALRRG